MSSFEPRQRACEVDAEFSTRIDDAKGALDEALAELEKVESLDGR